MGPINGGPINLAQARLRNASLRFATLTGANLRGADLADADLRDARLEGADLTGAELSKAHLDREDLAGASLTGANLCGVSLVGVRNLSTAQLHEAEGNASTVLPPYVDRPLIWTVTSAVDSQPLTTSSSERLAPGPLSSPSSVALAIESAPIDDDGPSAKHVTWLVGGPRGVGRRGRPQDSQKEPDSL